MNIRSYKGLFALNYAADYSMWYKDDTTLNLLRNHEFELELQRRGMSVRYECTV
jgi:hypothetical protein